MTKKQIRNQTKFMFLIILNSIYTLFKESDDFTLFLIGLLKKILDYDTMDSEEQEICIGVKDCIEDVLNFFDNVSQNDKLKPNVVLSILNESEVFNNNIKYANNFQYEKFDKIVTFLNLQSKSKETLQFESEEPAKKSKVESRPPASDNILLLTTDFDDEFDVEEFISTLPKSKQKETQKFANLFERISTSKNLYESFSDMNKKNRMKCIQTIKELDNDNTNETIKLLTSQIPNKVKSQIWSKMKNESITSSSDNKFKVWSEEILNFPWNSYSKNILLESCKSSKQYLNNASLILDKCTYGQKDAKHMFIKILAQTISNPNSKGKVIGLIGPAGTGKTRLVKEGISKVLGKPSANISMGGYNDSGSLEGFAYTYEGSRPGRIVDIVKQCGVLDPIIYLDEVDKIGKEEVSNVVMHLLDPNQNNSFHDKYFGNIDIDLSKVTWILSYNSPNKLSYILRDRITEIEVSGYTVNEKMIIAENHLIPDICKDLNLKVKVTKEVIKSLIQNYTCESGVRKLKEILFDVLSEYNFNQTINKSKKEKQAIIDTRNLAKYLLNKNPISLEMTHVKSTIGKITGMYASAVSVGGIIPIEVNWFPSDKILDCKLTGNLGKIMTESSQVAITVAWNYLNTDIQKEYFDKWKEGKQGFHIHCSEASIQKEGPSAGVALTVCLISLLLNIPISNKVGVTGEINLSGDVMEVGGIRDKLYGAKNAGCTLALIPYANNKNLEQLKKEFPDLVDGNFQVKTIKTLQEALKYCLMSELKI